MSVTRATLADIEELAALFDAYRVFYGQVSDVSGARAFLGQRLRREESVIFIARDEKGHATGFTQLYPLFSSVSMAPIWLLNDLFVAPQARRSGTGAALLAASRNHAQETGAARIELATAHTNTAAQALYEREGYRHETEFKRYLLNTRD